MIEKKSYREVKKSFFEVKAPLTSAKILLYSRSPEELHGKFIHLDLTRSLRGKNAELIMKIANIGEELIAEPVKLSLTGAYIRRSIRKGTDYVEDSFSVDCKDGSAVIKPFLITRKRVSRAVRKALRNSAKEAILGHVRIRTYKEIFSELMAHKLQKDLSLKLKKIYPLAFCDIRVFEIVERKK